MLFTIVEDFGPGQGERWREYVAWRGPAFERFESLDGILRPSLFSPETDEDWQHVLCENFKISYLTDLPYARRKHRELGRGRVVGLAHTDHDEQHDGFLGYDILDGYADVSLLTNWGNDVTMVNRALEKNALVPGYAAVRGIQEHLKRHYGDDPHVQGCEVISVYRL